MKLVRGAAFTAQVDFGKLVVTFPAKAKPRTVPSSHIESVEMLPNGNAKLIITRRRDLVIPTTRQEYLRLAETVNEILDEMRAMELRTKLRPLKAWSPGLGTSRRHRARI